MSDEIFFMLNFSQLQCLMTPLWLKLTAEKGKWISEVGGIRAAALDPLLQRLFSQQLYGTSSRYIDLLYGNLYLKVTVLLG